MPAPLTAEQREAILDDIRAGELSRNAIARKHRRSPSTVSGIAKDEGLDGLAFDRTLTARASRAKQVDNRARRAELVRLYLDDAARIRERLWLPAEQVTATGEVVSLALPGGRDVRDFVMAGTSAVKATIDIEKHDVGDEAADEAKSMLLGVADGLRALYDASGMASATSGDSGALDGGSN